MLALVWFIVVWGVVMATIHYFRSSSKGGNNKAKE